MVKRSGRAVLYFLPILTILLLFYTPVLRVLSKGLNITFLNEVINSNYYKKVITFTLYQAFLSSILSVLIAIPGAYIVTRYKFPGKKLFLSLSSLPFVLPSILTVLGFVLLFGNRGLINTLLMRIFSLESPPLQILYSLKAVLLAHVFYNFPLAIRIISSLWKKIPYELTEASYSLGSSPLATFRKVTLPHLSNAIITSFTLIFLYCFMSFGIILVLGGGPSLSTIEVEVYRFARVSLNLPKAAFLALIESFITVTILVIYIKLESKRSELPQGRIIQKDVKLKELLLFSIYLIPLFIIILAPVMTIVVNSFITKEGFTGNKIVSLHWYKSIFGYLLNRFSLTALKAIKNSLILGMFTVILCVPLSILVTYNLNKKTILSSIYKILFFLPMGISSIIIGLSYLSVDTIKGSYAAIIFAHTAISLPISIRSVNNIYKSVNKSLIESSMSLGVSRLKTFISIEVPLIKSGIITASVFTFALSIGEMNASIMLAPPGFVTIPLSIYQLIGSYNYYGACALGSILLVISLISFRLMDNIDY